MINDLLLNIFHRLPNTLRTIILDFFVIAMKKNYEKNEIKGQLFPSDYDDIINRKLGHIMNEVIPKTNYLNEIKFDKKSNNSYKENIKTFPILSKKDYQNNQIVNLEAKSSQHIMKMTTSGSTGEPASYFRTDDEWKLINSYKNKMYAYVGINKEDIECRFSSRIFSPRNAKKNYNVYSKKMRRLQCSSFHLNEKTYDEYLKDMKKYRCNYGTGYAMTWLKLANYILKTPPCIMPKLKSIILDSEGVSVREKDIIERAFLCPVYLTYGSTELGQVAITCERNKYHVIPEMCYLESCDGLIIATSFISEYNPIVRYNTKDIAKISERCLCGIPGQYIDNLIGREDDYLIIDNELVNRLSPFIKQFGFIDKAQIIQNNLKEIKIKIYNYNRAITYSEMNKIKNKFRKYFNTEMVIEIENSDDFVQLDSGKTPLVICRVERTMNFEKN